MTNNTCIEINDLRKRYKKASVDSLKKVSFTIYKNEKFGILGPNGAGKTTLISILCGILPSSSGSYTYHNDTHTLKPDEVKPCIGYVPQDFAFYEELTPRQNIEYFGAFYKLPKYVIKERINEIFEILELTELENRKIKTFSGGFKRRVNLAIGIINKPEVLFLDEPTVGADVQSKFAMIEYLNKINNDGTTIVYTSHHMEEAESFCDRIAFIDKGSLVAYDTTESLLNKHNGCDLQSLFIKLTGRKNYDDYE